MAIYKNIECHWHEEPNEPFTTTVCVGAEWDENEEDENIFFYFLTQEEFDEAIASEGKGYEFRIIGVED